MTKIDDLSHKFEVPIAMNMSQALYALDHLNTTINDIYDNIENTIKKQDNLLEKINARVLIAQNKINRISENTKQATTIYSSCKYPTKKQLQPYHSLFNVDIINNNQVKVNEQEFSTIIKSKNANDIQNEQIDTNELFKELSSYRAHRAEKNKKR